MEQYLISDEQTLAPAVVIATALLIAAFALGIAYQLVLLVL